MLFAGGLPESFKEAYPFRPLVIRAGTDGNLKEMQISRFTVDLPGAFALEGGGLLENLDRQPHTHRNHRSENDHSKPELPDRSVGSKPLMARLLFLTV